MPVKISPLKILNDLGYEMVDIESDEDYLSALMEAIVSLQGAGGSGRERADILQEELIRVRKARKAAAPSAGMKVTQKKISTSKFFGKEEKQTTAADTTGTSALAVRSKTGKIDKKKFIPEPTEEKGGALAEILTGVNSIVETLKAGQKQDKKHQSWLQKLQERFKRRKKEKKLEFKVLDGIKKTATTLLKPFKSAWQKMLDFIGKVLLGRVLFKVLEWMGDKENQGKLKSIIKFFEDWWPVLLGGYLIFGNALTGFALGLLKNVVVWGAKLVATVIPALLKAAVALGPWGVAAVAVLGGAAYLATKKNKTDQGIDQSVQEQGRDETVDQLKEEKESKNMMERVGGFFTGEGQEREEQIQKVETGTEKRYGFFGELDRPAETQNFKEGGLVQHYNNATQQASNIIQGFNEGGPVIGYGMGEIMPEQFIFNRQEYKSTYKTKGGEVIQDSETFTDIGGAIGVPDLIENQTQLVEEIRKVPGYEDINFMDVMQYPDGQGRLVGMPPETLYPILMNSDAQAATFAKMDAANQRFLQDNDLINPDGSTKGYSYYDGKLKVDGETRDAVLADGAIRKFNKGGGVVSGPGGVDKVPARLTAGEFVMSKGAVEKYGVNTLAAMNAAGGGTNIPTLMGGKPAYEGGGLVTVKPGTINSYQDAIDAGIEVEDIVAGNMRFGSIRWREKLPKGWFGKQKYQIKGTKWNVSGTGGGADKELAMSTKDFVNTRMGWSKASSAKVEPVKSKSDISKQSSTSGGRGQGNKIRNRIVPSKSGDPNIQPSEKKKVTVAYEEEKDKMSDKPSMDKPGKEIPPFDVTKGRSPQKMKVLGISV
tara:strand:- start:987 stop:3458 length:2472 start_codon:yes stop_codon:yes gene_type:complete